MYSGLLPKGLDEAELSTDEDEDSVLNTQSKTGRKADTPNQFNNCLSRSQSDLSSQKKTGSICDRCCTSTSVQNDPSLNDCLPGVRLDLWQKFKAIQEEKEVQKMKEPQKKKKRKMHHQKGRAEEQDNSEENREKAHIKQWEELTQYFGVNDRFQPPACGRPPPKSGLEKSMESAIAEGDYGKAEELSDRLASRELAVKITQAVDCRDFSRTRQEEEAAQASRKRRSRVAWGFEAKKRWETKSNMGYM